MPTEDLSAVLPGTRAILIAAELRRLILAGELLPGTRLRQSEIARRFDVSTTPVREAFFSLAREGLVRQDVQRGVTVFQPSKAELNEIYAIRAVLEPLSVQLAAANFTPACIEILDGLNERMGAASATEMQAINREFHGYIDAKARRPRLTAIIVGLREASASYLSLTVRFPSSSYAQRVLRDHIDIAEGLRQASPVAAARAMAAHLDHSKDRLMEIFGADGAAALPRPGLSR